MDGLPLVLYLTLLLYPVLSFIPAPVNLKVISNNFQHVLHWDPGPGTPAGTQYRVIWRLSGRVKERLSNSMTTSLNLTLPPLKEAFLTVQASYNQTLSERSSKISFTPFSQTTIGPPKVTLAGCGYCIHLNISLPEVDRSLRIKDIKAIYHDVQFEIFWSKHKGAMQSAITRNNSYTVNNLQIGTEYCVQVYIRINTNRNNVPSALNCTLTSVVEPSRDPVFVGAVAALLIGIGALMSLMFCLYYTGFLCKMKETLPGVLEALSQGYTLTPERTAPDNISIGAETEQQRMRHNPPAPQAATTDTDEEEEEEEGENVYMNRDAELSSGENSGQHSFDVLGNSKVAVSGGSGSSTVKAEVQDTEFEVEIRHWALDQNEAKAEGTEVSFMPEGPVTGKVKEEEEEEEEEEEVCENLGNIHLFSITLAALEGNEGEEQNTRESLTDFLSDVEPLLPTNSKRTLSHTDSQTESDDRTTLTLPTQEDFTEDGYEVRCMNTSFDCLSNCDGETQHEKTQEEEEEEEVCENLGNINLFSVTLAALEGNEGEEQNTRESLTDFLSDVEPLLPTNSKRTLSHTDSQTESDDRTTLTLPTQEDFTEDGYEVRCMNTSFDCLSNCDGETQHEKTQEEEEEEEEEEFSGYMRHT